MTKKPIVCFLACGLLCSAEVLAADGILVEAESFERAGGWVVDQQFMDVMGSPFLLAHGLGKPVADAETTVAVPSAGTYRIWVRTRDWVAPWKRPDTPETKRAFGAPGVFKLMVNGLPLAATFGTEGEAWHWQDGGTADLPAGKTRLALRDLTGFGGRCDAVLLSSDLAYVPPDDAPAPWRRSLLGIPEQPEAAGEFDLVVAGGGTAGVPAAIAAARLGLKVALVHNRPVLGGNASSEVRVGYTGRGLYEPYPRIGLLVQEIQWSRKESHPGQRYERTSLEDMVSAEDRRRMDLAMAEPNLALFLDHHVNGVEKGGDGRIAAVVARHIASSRRVRIAGRWFADCTGDANLGLLAGADLEMAIPHMGRSNLWTIRRTKEEQPFPACPWALNLAEKPFPGRGGSMAEFETGDFTSLGGWYWESGFDHDPIAKGEYIRDWNFRARYGAWDAVKNVEKLRARDEIGWMAYISGMRESRRLMGDLVLAEEDLLEGRKYPDGCVPLSWRIDVHEPHPDFTKGFEGDAFIAIAPHDNTRYKTPYWLPYRTLYSRNVPNLFMAGRNISVTSRALGAVRVQWTTGMMGEVVGMAASLCKKHNTNPRGVHEAHLPELFGLMKDGVGREAPAAALPAAVPARRVPAAGAATLLAADGFASANPAWAFCGPDGSKAEIRDGRLVLAVGDKSSLSTAAYLPFPETVLEDGQALRLTVEVSTDNPQRRKGDLRIGLGFADPPVASGPGFKVAVAGYHVGAPSGGQAGSVSHRWNNPPDGGSDFLFAATRTLGNQANTASIAASPTLWVYEIARRGDRLEFSGSLEGKRFGKQVVAEGEDVLEGFRFNTIALGYLYARGRSAAFENMKLELIAP